MFLLKNKILKVLVFLQLTLNFYKLWLLWGVIGCLMSISSMVSAMSVLLVSMSVTAVDVVTVAGAMRWVWSVVRATMGATVRAAMRAMSVLLLFLWSTTVTEDGADGQEEEEGEILKNI